MATKNVNTEAVQAEETEKKEAVNILDLLLGSDVGEIKLPTKEVEITRLSQVYGAPFILTIKAITPAKFEEIQDMSIDVKGYLKADEQVADFATDMLSSIAGAKPASGLTQNLTRANVRKLCTNRGKGWKSHNIFALTATQWLILVEYASMNAQSVIGQGVSTFTDDGSTNMAVVTGATSGLGNGSGIDPNAGVDGKCSVSYRGEENLWGNIWTWLDAINIYNDKESGVYNAFVKPYGECKDDTTADGYKALDFNIATGEGYISGFGYDEDHPDLFLCAEHNGASNLPVGDYYWNNNDGFRVTLLGGRWSDGAKCGAWCLDLDGASSSRLRDLGGRLLYVPQTKISA